jgi:hypothetical protein
LHGRDEGRSRKALAAAAGARGVVSGDLSTMLRTGCRDAILLAGLINGLQCPTLLGLTVANDRRAFRHKFSQNSVSHYNVQHRLLACPIWSWRRAWSCSVPPRDFSLSPWPGQRRVRSELLPDGVATGTAAKVPGSEPVARLGTGESGLAPGGRWIRTCSTALRAAAAGMTKVRCRVILGALPNLK